VERFCFFAGYARSGHTLVASLLDAHPEVVISNELDAFRYFDHGFRRHQVYGLILWHEHLFGYDKEGFDYSVAEGHQGSAVRLRVIGDKRGAATGFRLGGDPTLIDRVRRMVAVPIRVIHHIRNPFDVIATNARVEAPEGSEPRLDESIRWFGMWARNVARIRPHLRPGELIDTRHEALVAAPAAELARLCAFLGVGADRSYLDRCAAAVWPSPRVSRQSVSWTAEQRATVDTTIATHPWLDGYTYDDL
jgi:hypothetical protein